MRISVVITTFNRPNGLRKTLDSIYAQYRPPDEVIVSDDGTDHDYKSLIDQYQNRFAGFHFARNASNVGMPANLNKAISMASGDVIVNLHDGDWYYPELLELIVSRLESNPQCGLVFWADSNDYWKPRGIAEVTPGHLFFQQHYLQASSSKIWGTAAVRSSVYDKVGQFNPEFGGYADVDMWMRICAVSDICYLPRPLVDLEPESHFRKWSWRTPLLVQDLVMANIQRIYKDKPAVLEHALKKQSEVRRNQWLYHMAARIKNFHLVEIIRGLLIAPKYLGSDVKSPEK